MIWWLYVNLRFCLLVNYFYSSESYDFLNMSLGPKILKRFGTYDPFHKHNVLFHIHIVSINQSLNTHHTQRCRDLDLLKG